MLPWGGVLSAKKRTQEAFCTCNDGLDFYRETHFKRLVVRERMRSERSRIPLLLVLLDFSECLEHCYGRIEKIENFLKSLSIHIRETDLRGWYKKDRVIGILFTDTPPDSKQIIISKINRGIDNHIGPEYGELIDIGVIPFPSDNLSLSELKFLYPQEDDSKKKSHLIVKRYIDIVVSLFSLLILSPVFLIIAVLVKITSPGPVFFRQLRVGQGGQLFTLLKFRSMYVNNSDTIHKEYVSKLINGKVVSSNGIYKIEDDPRITPVGKILRKCSFDELPQFFNVLKGEMSLVGPRPPIPYETEQYKHWHFRRVLEVKPGITGFWQVAGRSRTTFDEMVRMDIRYINSQSLSLDLKLLIKTPFSLLFGRGAY
ncbi:MAG: sugar transferase [Fibrobacter sp.]|nr:sugar transferase [Fibrobacter sp.]